MPSRGIGIKSYRLSARFSVHVVRGLRLVVSIRNSIARGSGGSFYFVSAVIFDEGQIATRALADHTGRLPRADHLKRERERWMRRGAEGGGGGGGGEKEKRGVEQERERGASIWTVTRTNVHLCGHCTAFPSSPSFSITYLHPVALPSSLRPPSSSTFRMFELRPVD